MPRRWGSLGGAELKGHVEGHKAGVAAERKRCAEETVRLREAAMLARAALERLMGDSDLPEDDSPEMKAMQALNAALPDPV